MHVFRCVICDEEWLPKSVPSDFRLSHPQGGRGFCEGEGTNNCAKEELHEEPFEKKSREYEEGDWSIKTTEIPQQESFSYDCYATTNEPRGPWEQQHKKGKWWYATTKPGRSEHCRRLLRITIPCCLESCENEEVIVHFTENTVRRWGAGPLRIWFERGSLWYKSAYYECCGIEHTPDDGDEMEEWADRFCEAEGHECESCKNWFENGLYTNNRTELIESYMQQMIEPTRESRQSYKRRAQHWRRKWSTQKPQIEATTLILGTFLGTKIGEVGSKCIRSGLTVGPQNEYGRFSECGFLPKSRDIEIPLPGGRFIGNGYICDKHD